MQLLISIIIILIYCSNIDIFSITCVPFNILFEFDIFVLSSLFDMSNTLYYRTLRVNVRENWRVNQQWTIQRNWQHWYTRSKKHNTTCAEHHYAQANWNNVNDDFKESEAYSEDIYRVLRTITTAVYPRLLDFATVSVI